MPAKLNREAELGFPRWDWQGSPRVPSEHPHTPAPGGPASLPVTLWRLPGSRSPGARAWVKAIAVKQSSESLPKV